MSADEREDRFARLRLIDWWDQRRLADARVLVVGAGALGNEVIKNLALLGVGHLLIVDSDRIEASNLSRTVLFRTRDASLPKATVAAAAASEIHGATAAAGLVADAVHGVGLGAFRWASVVIGAVDNREARLAVNRNCYRTGTPWIDGAIDVLSGVARVFSPPDGACYECTMSERDWDLLAERRSCSLLARTLVPLGRVPTTPTAASIIGAIQCQEALKILHDRPALSGAGVVFDGVGHTSYVATYPRKPDCQSHDPLPAVEALDRTAGGTTVREALGWAKDSLGPGAGLEFCRELLRSLACPECGDEEILMRPLVQVTEQDGECPHCGARRTPGLFHRVGGTEGFLDRTLAEIGLPPWDVVLGRAGDRWAAFELAGDRAAVLGAAGAPAGGRREAPPRG